MSFLPIRRKRSKVDKVADAAKAVAQVWTSMKLGSAAAKAAQTGGKAVKKGAKTGAKAYGTVKVGGFFGKRAVRLAAIPAAAAGGFFVFRKARSSSESPPEATYGSPVGPVAAPETVSPPSAGPVAPPAPAPGVSTPAAGTTPDPGATTPGAGTSGAGTSSNGEGALSDTPAGAANPPAEPGGASDVPPPAPPAPDAPERTESSGFNPSHRPNAE
jgi:DNA polymerase-3 subunit gamma/tau